MLTAQSPDRALEEQTVWDLQRVGRLTFRRVFFERGVDEIDVDHAAFEALLLAVLDHLDAFVETERPRRKDQHRAKDIGQHAPNGKECHGGDGRKAGECRPQHRGRYAEPFEYE